MKLSEKVLAMILLKDAYEFTNRDGFALELRGGKEANLIKEKPLPKQRAK